MAAPGNVIEKRKASALIKGAQLGLAGRMLFGLEGRLSHSIAKKMMGGSWITGTAYLTPETVEFHPDFLDARLHKDADALRVVIPLDEITAIEVRQGLATPIVDIETAETSLSFRCYRGKAFQAAIEAARNQNGC